MIFQQQKYFLRNKPVFEEHIKPKFAGLPIKYLEIGVWTAGSLHWMLSRVLIHPEARCIAIDPYIPMGAKHPEEQMEQVYNEAKEKCASWIENGQLDLIRGRSCDVLPTLTGLDSTFDICYIDGDHKKEAVLIDARYCFRLLKPGGWLVFDDVRQYHPKPDEVQAALDVFPPLLEGQLKEVWRSRFANCYEKL